MMNKRGNYYWDDKKGFIRRNFIMKSLEIEIVGYFPYHTASLIGKTNLILPRSLFKAFETALIGTEMIDNKIVYICKPYEGNYINLSLNCFALMLKDSWALVGSWESVKDYEGGLLKIKKGKCYSKEEADDKK